MTIKIFCGCMYSGKSSALIKEYQKYKGEGKFVFKPSVKTNRDSGVVGSRDENRKDKIKAITIDKDNPKEILNHCNNKTKAVFLDETQFFSVELAEVVKDLSKRGIDIFIACLDMTFEGKEWETFAELKKIDGVIVKKKFAECRVPGCVVKNATHSLRCVAGGELIKTNTRYEPRCEQHWREGTSL